MEIDEEAYLEHYGVKGMKWGVRNDKYTGTKFKNRKKSQKLGLVVGTWGGMQVGSLIGAVFAKKMPIVGLASTVVGTKLGYQYTREYFDRQDDPTWIDDIK